MARIAVAHATFDVPGGTEAFALNAAATLVEAGHDVWVITATPVDPYRLSQASGVDVSRLRFVRLRPSLEAVAGLARGRLARLRRLAFYESLFRSDVPERFDLVFDTQSNVPSKAQLVYISYPAVYDTLERRGALASLYGWLVKRYIKRVIGRPRVVTTNSSWTAQRVRDAFGIEGATPIYSPIDVQFFGKALDGPHDMPLALTVSRLMPEKRLEGLLDIASLVKDVRFVIVGSTVKGVSEKVVERIESEARRRHIDNVEVRPDVPRGELLELMSRSKVYVHPPFPEHFGRSVAEAMAAGLVPVVYRDGGAWTDMASRVDPGLGYSSAEEAARAIRLALSRWGELSRRAAEVAKDFSREKFRERLLAAVSEALG